MTFGQEIALKVIDTLILGGLVFVVGYWLNRALEKHKSDLEWRKSIATARTQTYRELWALTQALGGTGNTTPLDTARRKAISSTLSEWYWDKGNGLFLTHATTSHLMHGWKLLGDNSSSDRDIRDYYSSLRTHLKTESGVYSPKEAASSIGS